MSVRLRRLKADYDKISSAFDQESCIKVIKTVGSPPEKYHIKFSIDSLQQNPHTQKISKGNSFTAEIILSGRYPRSAPTCRMLTSVFHPNIAPHAICIGDHWAAGESLLNTIIRIAEMLSFQSYNIKSPLNGEAAKWVERNEQRLPLDTFDFSSLMSKGEVLGKNTDGTLKTDNRCANCGMQSNNLSVCSSQHVMCPDCKINCPLCSSDLCLSCSLQKCSSCSTSVCYQCVYKCQSCNNIQCKKHVLGCNVCKRGYCTDCTVPCYNCKKNTCINHIKKVIVNNSKQYLCLTCNPG